MAYDCDSNVVEVNYEMPYIELYSRLVELHKSMPLIFVVAADSPWVSIDRPVMLMRFSWLVQRTLSGLWRRPRLRSHPSGQNSSM